MTPFEAIVRPTIGDAYDAAFPARPLLERKPGATDASLTADEQHVAEALCDVYARAACLKNAATQHKVRTGVVSALKSLRLSAETRKGRAEVAAVRGTRYRFRATAPDGTEILYPRNGTKHIGRRYARIYRRTPKPTDQIEVTVRAHYAPHFASSPSAEFTARLEEAVARDIAREIEIQNDHSAWYVSDYGSSYALRDPYRRENEPTARWHYESAVVEGSPFDADAALTHAKARA